MKIKTNLIKYNYSRRQGAIKYLVIHDTGNTSAGADAEAHFQYFNGGDRQSSAHYFVDDKQVLEVVDPNINRSWHCGDGGGKYGITNDNSIGIEICINKDGNYKKAVANTQELVRTLMKRYNINVNNVVRHYDASKKCCPKTLIKSVHGISWSDFKKGLEEQVLYRVCVGTYSDYNNAKKKAEETGGFIVEYKK